MAAIVNDRDALIMGAVPRYTPPANIGLFLSPESAIFKLSADQSSALPGSFTFKALPPNAEGVVTFTWSAGLTFTVSGNTATLTYANFTAGSGTLTATIVVDGVTYTKTSTITNLADGAPGAAGTKSAPVFLYQWSASAPAAPTGTSTLTWATGINSNYTGADGWAASAPANPGTPGLRLYVVTRTVTAAADVATTPGISYLGLTAMAWTQNGAAGVPGLQSAAAEVYQWAATIPAGPVGNPTWNWNTRSFGAAPANWTLTPAAPVAGHTLWAAVVQVVDSAGATGTAFNWNAASIVARGSAGSNGAAGGAGAEGSSYVTAYVATAVGTASTAPAPTIGKTSLPAPNSSGLPGTPQASVPALSAGQYLMQFDGIYNPATNQVTWSVPYQASLKVGSLSAITTNTGALTVTGDLSSANGLFKVDANGQATMRAVQILAADGNILFSTGTGLSAAAAAPGTLNSEQTWDALNGRPLDSTNLVRTPNFEDGALRTWNGAGGASVSGNGVQSPAFPNKYFMRVTLRDTTEGGNTFPVTPGEKFYTSAWVYTGDSSVAVGLGLVYRDNNGEIFSFGIQNRAAAGVAAWVKVTGEVIVPANAAQATAWVQMDGFTNLGAAGVANMIISRSEPGATVGATWGTNVTGSAAVDAQILTAKNSADAAMVRVNAEADNNVLDRGEKPEVLAAWLAIEDERPRLILQAQDVSVSYADYDNAKQSLSVYLQSLPGGPNEWYNTLTDTTIVRDTYIQKWNSYYTAKVELLKAISAKLQSNVNYVQGQAVAAQNAANTAQGAANAALVRVNAEADNNTLDRGEKPGVLAAWNEIEAERPKLILQAQSLSVNYAPYDAAKQALADYLVSLPGGQNEWYNTLTDTPIVRDTYIQKWNGYYAAKVDLLNAIAARAAVLASWSGVTGAGKPADNATVGGTFGPNGNITGQMTVAQVPNYIPANGVTDALIGGNLKSANWNGATDTSGAGWLLERATGNLYCNSIRSRGAVMGGGYTGYAWPTGGVGGFYVGPEGLLLGNYSSGRFFQVESNGNVAAPGFSITNGKANFSGNVNTGSGSGFRIEMGPDDPVYAMWAGSGTKNDTNAIFYLKRSGTGYFGGALSAGTLKTAVTNPAIDPNAQVVDGPFGSNGGVINVVCSFDWSFLQSSNYHRYTAGAGTNTATLTLYRKIGSGAEQVVQSATLSGPTTIANASLPDEPSTCDQSIQGSFTYTDTAASTENRTYRAVLSLAIQTTVQSSRPGGGTGSAFPDLVYQRFTLITTE